MCLPPAVVPARILLTEDDHDGAPTRRRAGLDLVPMLSLCDDDDRRGVVPRPDSVASETLATALTGRRGVSESVLGGADQAGALGVP